MNSQLQRHCYRHSIYFHSWSRLFVPVCVFPFHLLSLEKILPHKYTLATLPNFQWIFVNIYLPAQEQQVLSFQSETEKLFSVEEISIRRIQIRVPNHPIWRLDTNFSFYLYAVFSLLSNYAPTRRWRKKNVLFLLFICSSVSAPRFIEQFLLVGKNVNVLSYASSTFHNDINNNNKSIRYLV